MYCWEARSLKKVIAKLEYILAGMGLRLNKLKSKRVNLWKKTMGFLDLTVRYARTSYKGFRNKFWNILPPQKSKKACDRKSRQS
jgi:hypothetical protein